MKQRILRWLPTIFLICLGFLYMSPFIVYPAFNLIDDGASIHVAQQLLHNVSVDQWSKILVERATGRFRPLFHLILFVVYALFGARPLFFWLFQALLLVLTMVGMMFFLERVTKHRWAAAAMSALLLLVPAVSENFYRLGTAEPKQMLFWVWLLVWVEKVKSFGWTKKNIFVCTLLFVLAVFTKETSFLFAGILFVFTAFDFLMRSRRKYADLLICCVFAATVGIFLLSLPHATGYSTGFKLDLSTMKAHLLYARLTFAALFFPLLLAILSTVTRFIKQYSVDHRIQWADFFWPAILLSQFLAIFVIALLPWTYQLGRYYYPLYIVGLLYIGVELFAWKNQLGWWRKLGMQKQLTLASVGFLAAFESLLIVFQGALGFDPEPLTMWQRLLQFRVVAGPMLLLLCAGVGVTVIRLGLTLIFRSAKKKLTINDGMWQLVFLLAVGFSLLWGVMVWHSIAPYTALLFDILIGGYWLSEWMSWQESIHQTWFRKVGRGPLLSFTLALCICLTQINTTLFAGKAVTLQPFLNGVIISTTDLFSTYQLSYALIKELLRQVPPQTQVYVVGDDYEVIFEIGLYASQFQKQPITLYTTNQQLVHDLQPGYSYLQYTPSSLNAFASASATTKDSLLVIRKKDWDASALASSAGQLSVEECSPSANMGYFPESVNWLLVK